MLVSTLSLVSSESVASSTETACGVCLSHSQMFSEERICRRMRMGMRRRREEGEEEEEGGRKRRWGRRRKSASER